MSSGELASRVLAQKYRLVSLLGEGGMGSVWRAEHLDLHSPVAVKLLHERVLNNPDAAERFVREARAAAALRSQNVVQVLDVGVDQNTPYIVMELLEGQSLAQRLRSGPLPLAATAQIVAQIARALHKAHEMGIVHRDLKPDNVFLVRDLHQEHVKVLDFGIAKIAGVLELQTLTGTGAVLGTPHYMSPEQARGRRDVDYRSDLWSLGVISYECLTGRRPFDSDALGDLLLRICTDPLPAVTALAAVPPEVDAWLARALARDPAERFRSAVEMSDGLSTLAGVPTLSGGASEASFASLPPSASLAPSARLSASTPAAPPRRSSAGLLLGIAALGIGILGVVVAGVVGLVWYSQLEPTAATADPPAPSVATPVATETPTAAPPPPVTAKAPVAVKAPSKSTPTATPPATAAAKPTATTAATDSAPCVAACQKIRACGESCDSSGPCIGIKRTIAICVNGKSGCFALLDCLK